MKKGKKRNGYASQAMLMLCDRVKAENPNARRLGLSYEPENLVAEKLYRSLGFRPTGEKHEGHIVVMVDLF